MTLALQISVQLRTKHIFQVKVDDTVVEQLFLIQTTVIIGVYRKFRPGEHRLCWY